MSVARLMTDLTRLGIRIEAHGDRLRYSPRSAMTPDLADRLKAHKAELLSILRGGDESPDESPKVDLTDAAELWQAIVDELADDPRFPPDIMTALRAADARWISSPE